MNAGSTTDSRPVIVHVIDSLTRGGAETMLVSLLPELVRHYEIILVTLEEHSEFAALPCTVHCIQFTSYRNLPSAVTALRGIIRKYRPVLVRSQLYWSTLIARFATPYEIPLVFSVHSVLSADAFSKNRLSLWLERLTYRKRHTLICVSQIALDDYSTYIRTGPHCHVLHNFVDEAFFRTNYSVRPEPDVLRLVAVGNLKEAKNYGFLLQVLHRLKDRMPVTLDIYGEGHLRAELEETIRTQGLPVRLLGKSDALANLLPGYDAFIMSSLYEGFGIAPAEAMAVGLPLVLNDLPVFREMSGGNALFYPSGDIEATVSLLSGFARNPARTSVAEQGRELARSRYRRTPYVDRLKRIYEDAIVRSKAEN